jgi:ABC-2 type transport system permease protein
MRLLYWSLRRELWENRSVYLAPLIVMAFVLFGTFISLFGLPRRIQNVPANDAAKQHATVVRPFHMAPAPIILATFVVGFFYALDALHGERRDRSILFWKSLPVSDRITVLSKAAVPLAVLPSIGLLLGVLSQIVLMILSTIVLLGHRMNPAVLWTEFRLVPETLVMIYGVTVHVLWWAPIYGWLLLVSAWVRRTPLLWAAAPLVAIAIIERMAFNTSNFLAFVKYRLGGALTLAFKSPSDAHAGKAIERFSELDPGRILSTTGLWIGLIVAAACLFAAIRLRRKREPI